MTAARKVFISHSTSDQRDAALAQGLAAGLNARGVEVCIASDCIPVGAEWNDEIVTALMRECTDFLVILSAASVASVWVLKEIALARARAEKDPAFGVLTLEVGEVGEYPGRDFLGGRQLVPYRAEFDAQIAEVAQSFGLADGLPASTSGRAVSRDGVLDVTKLLKDWVYRKFGIRGLVAMALLTGLGTAVWNWEDTTRKVAALPGATRVVEMLPLPKADSRRFAVAVAHLENDDRHEYERAIIEALSSLEAVQLLRFNRTVAVPLGGSRPHESVKAGHEKARRYLRASGAHLLIWGTGLRREGKGLA